MDGLYGYQFNLDTSLKLKNGILIFATTDGCIYFNPKELKGYKIYQNEVIIDDIYWRK